MGARTRLVAAGLLLVGVAIGLTACMGGWFNPQVVATLIIGNPVAKGGNYEVLISVANMPDQGIAGIQINDGGITTTNVAATSIVANGLNGFVVTASDFTAPAPQGCLMAVNPATGIIGGTVLKLTFTATGANPTVTLHEAQIKLLSHLNTWITTWSLETGKKYYTK